MREGEKQTSAGSAAQQQQQQPKPDDRRRDLYGGPYKGSSMVFTKDATCMVVKVRDVKHLFVAPEADPFSAYDYEVMGEAVLIRVCRMLATKHFLDATPHPFRFLTILWCYLRQPKLALDRLIVQVPLNMYQDDCTETVNAALKRYCELRIYDNHLRIKVMRRKNDSLLVFGFLMLFLFIGLAMLFSSEHVPESNFTATLAEGFNILGWVLLWHPWETWVFDPIQVRTDVKYQNQDKEYSVRLWKIAIDVI